MTAIEARFHDGKSSQQRRVLIHVDGDVGGLRVTGEGIDFSCPQSEVRFSSRVGNSQRYLYFADGSQCETSDNDAVDALFAGRPDSARERLLHLWESRARYVILFLGLAVLTVWVVADYGVPALAKQVAFALPQSTNQMLGQGALEALDNVLLQPTRLPPERGSELQTLFARMKANIEGADAYRLELRSSAKIGPNALALPSGLVVMTDALVELARNDAELTAVLAHELGHLRQRHALRQMLQSSAVTLALVAATGDIASLASIAVALPAMVVQSKYSRDFEREADDFASEYMQQQAISMQAMADILLRMEKQRGASGGGVGDYLSSHPGTQERVDRALGK